MILGKLARGLVLITACAYGYSFLCDRTLLWYRQSLVEKYTRRKQELEAEEKRDECRLQQLRKQQSMR